MLFLLKVPLTHSSFLSKCQPPPPPSPLFTFHAHHINSKRNQKPKSERNYFDRHISGVFGQLFPPSIFSNFSFSSTINILPFPIYRHSNAFHHLLSYNMFLLFSLSFTDLLLLAFTIPLILLLICKIDILIKTNVLNRLLLTEHQKHKTYKSVPHTTYEHNLLSPENTI